MNLNIRLKGLVKYWLSGNSEKPLIFFAHGALVDHAQFDLQMHLLNENYQIIRWDMRGHGKYFRRTWH